MKNYIKVSTVPTGMHRSLPFRQNLLVIPSAESSCILVQADTILMLRSSTTYNKQCHA